MKTCINEIKELKSSNELINNKLEENNKGIISLKKELEEKNNISSNENIDDKIIDKKMKSKINKYNKDLSKLNDNEVKKSIDKNLKDIIDVKLKDYINT